VPRPFQGKIELDVRNSQADWPAFLADKAPEGAPNVLVILYDDTGQAAWSPYGGRHRDGPTLDRPREERPDLHAMQPRGVLARRARASSPAQHHQNGSARIAESGGGYPGYARAIYPRRTRRSPTVLRGRRVEHVLGRQEPQRARRCLDSRRHPQGAGRWAWAKTGFYGFIGGETNQWFPELIEDNHFVSNPRCRRTATTSRRTSPTRHLLHPRHQAVRARQALVHVVLPGANHAPHHAPQDYIDKYKGKFDDGYEAYREWVLARMIERASCRRAPSSRRSTRCAGHVSRGDSVRPWDTLSADEKRSSAAWPRSTPASPNTPTCRSAGDRLPRGIRPARQHADLLLRRQRRLGRGQPERLGQREPFFNGYPDDIETTWR
jgi:arylsulfatase